MNSLTDRRGVGKVIGPMSIKTGQHDQPRRVIQFLAHKLTSKLAHPVGRRLGKQPAALVGGQHLLAQFEQSFPMPGKQPAVTVGEVAQAVLLAVRNPLRMIGPGEKLAIEDPAVLAHLTSRPMIGRITGDQTRRPGW